jgi:hypothetical protein
MTHNQKGFIQKSEVIRNIYSSRTCVDCDNKQAEKDEQQVG